MKVLLFISTLFFLGGQKKSITAVPAPGTTLWTASWSHDDSSVAIGNDQGVLAVFETTNWTETRRWTSPATTITRVEWNPRYPILAVAAFSHDSKPSIVQLYDAGKNEVIKSLPDTLYGRCVSWRPDGESVAWVGARGKISLFAKDGSLQKTLSFTNRASLLDIDWHPNKNLLLAVEEDIYLIDADRDSVVANYHDGATGKGILCCQWHPSGRFFVTGDYGHEGETEPSYLKFWSPEGKLLKRVDEGKAEFRNVRWSNDGRYLAAATDGLLLTNENGGLIKKAKLGNDNLWGISWNRNGDKIISTDQKGVICLTDSTGRLLKKFSL